MCGRFNLTAPGDEIAEAFDLDEVPSLSARYNIAPSQPIAVVGVQPRTARRGLAELTLGPRAPRPQSPANGGSSTRGRKPRPTGPASARRSASAAASSPLPASTSGRTGRGEAPALALPPDERAALRVRRAVGAAARNGRPRHVSHPHDGAERRSPRRVHDRMPVILPREAYARWLDPTADDTRALTALLEPFPDAAMTAYPVSTVVNSPANDDSSCVAPA